MKVIARKTRWTIPSFVSQQHLPYLSMAADPIPHKEQFLMKKCPHCDSTRIYTRNRARRTGCAIGTTIGAVGGAAGALSGAETGAALGLIAGPAGAGLGGLTGAVIGGVTGAIAAGAAGAKLGTFIDENILNNHQCLCCNFEFGDWHGSDSLNPVTTTCAPVLN